MLSFFQARCPVDPDTEEFLSAVYRSLLEHFGAPIANQPVVCPTPQEFPHTFAGTTQSLQPVVQALASRMGVPADSIQVSIYDKEDPHGELMEAGSLEGQWEPSKGEGFHLPPQDHSPDKSWIPMERSVAMNATAAVAQLAGEIALARLQDEGLLPEGEDADAIGAAADLAAIFFGYGIFIANAIFQEDSWSGGTSSGWSMSRRGSLTYPMAGLGLALHANARQEARPKWARYLRPDAKAPFRQGLRWLRKG